MNSLGSISVGKLWVLGRTQTLCIILAYDNSSPFIVPSFMF